MSPRVEVHRTLSSELKIVGSVFERISWDTYPTQGYTYHASQLSMTRYRHLLVSKGWATESSKCFVPSLSSQHWPSVWSLWYRGAGNELPSVDLEMVTPTTLALLTLKLGVAIMWSWLKDEKVAGFRRWFSFDLRDLLSVGHVCNRRLPVRRPKVEAGFHLESLKRGVERVGHARDSGGLGTVGRCGRPTRGSSVDWSHTLPGGSWWVPWLP